MPIPVLKSLSSVELERPALPPDPSDCAVLIHAEIGPPGDGTGADGFEFTVVTPSRLVDGPGARWGRGYLVVDQFSWEAVERAVRQILVRADRPTWAAAAAELAKEMHWEFEGFAP